LPSAAIVDGLAAASGAGCAAWARAPAGASVTARPTADAAARAKRLCAGKQTRFMKRAVRDGTIRNDTSYDSAKMRRKSRRCGQLLHRIRYCVYAAACPLRAGVDHWMSGLVFNPDEPNVG
jgi:hypothetical protein